MFEQQTRKPGEELLTPGQQHLKDLEAAAARNASDHRETVAERCRREEREQDEAKKAFVQVGIEGAKKLAEADALRKAQAEAHTKAIIAANEITKAANSPEVVEAAHEAERLRNSAPRTLCPLCRFPALLSEDGNILPHQYESGRTEYGTTAWATCDGPASESESMEVKIKIRN